MRSLFRFIVVSLGVVAASAIVVSGRKANPDRPARVIVSAAFPYGEAIAGDKLLGSIVSSGASTNNATTAAPFLMNYQDAGTRWFEIQCGAAVYINEGIGSSTAATSSNVLVQANQLFEERLVGSQDTVAILPVSGSATCNVYAYTF